MRALTIRKACERDIGGLGRLLEQVLEVHHRGRPDLFYGGVKKYTDEELKTILQNERTPVFVAVDAADEVCGYAFCVFEQHIGHNILTDVKTLYIDDLCVDEQCRGQHIGMALFAFVKAFAKDSGCYNVTLNVWACNESAKRFYDACGMKPQKYGMETIL
ncbi:MAG: GNAT family N-acetyltransferase [Clostridia bacterium]|nr:GNAT family N-acetyltransferase [Clostridia bacterium]